MLNPIDEDGLITVTEQAAIAAGHTMGLGDQQHSGQVAVASMHETLAGVAIAGRVVIGVGEREEAPILYVGEDVGARQGEEALAVDLAVKPLEGSKLCASGGPGAVAVLAAAERGGLLQVPDVYMEKIVVGPTARGRVHLDAPVAENLRNIAGAFGREVSDLTVVVLERERHRQLVADIRAAGARIRLIRDGDLAAGIAAAVRGTGVHAVMGIGGAPEGVLTAAAMRCLGGEIQGRLVALDGEPAEAHRLRLDGAGFSDPSRVYGTEELARGERIVFSCTGVTDGELLRGVRFFGGGARSLTLFMSLARRVIRFVDTIHRYDLTAPIQFH
ncbi:MAG: class II fructose-bisphosphatase [Acidobacteria bacterium]|nr:MAG: class II fructose-bisphosphatase [Acidobacteriota bacterium]